MENILLPSKMSFTPGEANESILTIEPLYYGYGTTIGNALRRVLLSSLEGAAVIAVKIKGAQHEFSTLEGVKEDMLEVILNLKLLRLKVHSDDSVMLKLKADKKGEVTAAAIEANADVEISNKDLVLATLTEDSSFEMDITVSRGRGYSAVEERDDTGMDIGTVAVDALFSPVLNAGLRVENTRVGEITNYDRLIMNIKTDGTVTPQEAVENATTIVMNHLNWINGQLMHGSLDGKEEEKGADNE